jgi:hypothetical protein
MQADSLIVTLSRLAISDNRRLTDWLLALGP